MASGEANETARVVLGDSRVLAYSDIGDPDGVPVLSCLGTPHSRIPHPDDHEVALALGVRVIAPERPGFGLSDPLPGRAVVDWADDARQLLDALDLPAVAVLGSSGGGPYAVATAATLPDRVAGLALVASGVPSTAPVHGDVVPLDEEGLVARGRQFEQWLRDDPDAFFAAVGITRSDWWLRMLAEAFRQGHAAYVEDHLLNHSDWSPALGRVAAPTRIWHGELDDNIPLAAVTWMAQRIPGATVTVIPEAGHDIAAQWPDVLTWLRDVRPT
ncbi:alpha/beta fold hydrolase [Jiangella endophytica]|uniref:alpha/beta fold hydrolase n=1 Tax=Jiangella endophytica TaxID=1623398 RepID=UPI001300A5B4|nr:alpha/beta hydrolase [Jiangella endophytica]